MGKYEDDVRYIYDYDDESKTEYLTLRKNNFDRTYVKLYWNRIEWVGIECYDRNGTFVRIELDYSEKGILGWLKGLTHLIEEARKEAK